MKRFIYPLMVAAATILPLSAQVTSHSDTGSWRVDSLQWRGELNIAVGGGEHNPFWMNANTHGLASPEKNNGYLRASIAKPLDRTNRFSWGAGVDLVGGIRRQSPFMIHQLYGELRYRCLDLMIGQKEIQGAISNPELSTGNLLFSGNASPIPQVRLGIFDYASIWGTKGWLGIKGYVSYGMFSDSKWLQNWVQDGVYTKNVLFHSKGLWLRNGNTDHFPLIFEAGIEMATQFGGEAWFYKNHKLIHVKAPTGLKSFWKALVPQPGGGNTLDSDQTNVEGNFIGNWTFALSWNPKADWSVKAYYQHMFEDHSMLYIEYPWYDGLYGVEAQFPKNRFVSRAVYEFMSLKNQTGPVYWDKTDKIPEQVSGRDNYYQNYMYAAWQHWGQIIGSPLALSPIYNDGTLTLQSTRVQMHHLGLEGDPIPQLHWRLLATWSRSWGTYDYPLPEVSDNFNFLAQINWRPEGRLKGWEGSLQLGADSGGLTGRNIGVGLSISRTGLIRF